MTDEKGKEEAQWLIDIAIERSPRIEAFARYALQAVEDRAALVDAAYSVLPQGEGYDTQWEARLRGVRTAARRHMRGEE